MKLIERIEKTIVYDKSIDEQLEELSQFDNLTEDDKLQLTSYIKSSESGVLIEYLGFERLINHLPSFLEFLQDTNWPAAGGAAKMLLEAGEILLPEIKRVFKEVLNDEIWHYWILILIVQKWNKELLEKIKPEIIELVLKGDKQGASIQALKILKQKGLITKQNVEYYYHYLINKFEGDKYWTDDLNEEIKGIG